MVPAHSPRVGLYLGEHPPGPLPEGYFPLDSLEKDVFRVSLAVVVASVQFYGKPVLAIMAWGDYEGLTETLEIMNDPQVMESSRRAARQIQDGSG